MEENKKITSKKIGLLVLILAVVVCVAGVLIYIGCHKKGDDVVTEETTLTEEDQKNAVVKAFNQDGVLKISGTNVRSLLEQLLGTDAFEVTVKDSGEAEILVVYKDGYICEAGVNGEERNARAWMYIGDGTDMACFRQTGEAGQWEGEISSVFGVLLQSGMAGQLEIPEKLELPELKVGDLTVEGGRIVLNNDYIKVAIKDSSAYKTLTGAETSGADVKAATDGVIDAIVDAFGLKVSFGLSGTKLDDINVLVDLDTSNLSDTVKNYLPPMLKGSIDFNLNDKADALSDVKADLEVSIKERAAKIQAELKSVIVGDVLRGLDCSGSMNVETSKIATSIAPEGAENSEGSYFIYGDESFGFRLAIDFSRTGAEKGTKVVDMEVSTSTTATKITKVDPFTSEEKDVTGEEEGQRLVEYSDNNKITFVAQVTEPGVLSYQAEKNGQPTISGTADFNAAPSMPDVPAEVADFVKNEMKK